MTLSTAAVEARLRQLFPGEVAVAVEAIGPIPAGALWPVELAAMVGAVPARLAEFAAGRVAARRALARLGHTPHALPMAPDRAAIWPAGISGSIAHAAGLAVAVARAGAPLGVDIEDDSGIAPELWPIICLPEELQRLGTSDTARQVKRIFCAKEAVFKAQTPASRALFGHEILAVTLVGEHFGAQFLSEAGAFRAGQTVRGRIDAADGLVLTGVAV